MDGGRGAICSRVGGGGTRSSLATVCATGSAAAPAATESTQTDGTGCEAAR
jgi:hypothetical protein